MNGLVQPDRKPNPHLWEVKKVYQNVKVHPVDLAKGKVRVENKFRFTDLSDFKAVAELRCDGELVQERAFDVNVAPMSSAEITLPLNGLSDLKGDCWVTVSFLLKQDTTWASRAHCVAWDQFALTRYAPPPVEAAAGLPPAKHDIVPGHGDQVAAGDIEVRFARESCALTSIKQGDRELLAAPLMPNFWKAPNDNQYRNQYQERMGPWQTAANRLELVRSDVQQHNGNCVIDIETKIPVGTRDMICDTRSHRMPVFMCGPITAPARNRAR